MPVSRLALVLPIFFSLGCAQRTEAAAEQSDATCSDGLDNNHDGTIDCDDLGCAAMPWCRVVPDAGPRDGMVVDSDVLPVCQDPIDVVFAVDMSTSMGGSLDNVEAGLARIYEVARGLTPQAQFSLIAFVDDVIVVNGCAPFASFDDLASAFDTWRIRCSTDVNPLSGLPAVDTPENSIDALYAAATECPWREGSTRIVIHATDTTFRERPAHFGESSLGAGIPALHTFAEVATAFTTRELRVGTFSPDTVDSAGYSTEFAGMQSLVQQTGGRAWNIRDAQNGSLDMATAISEMVEIEYCTLY